MGRYDKILFLTLRTFSATGGIEKVCRIIGYALGKILPNGKNASLFSLYDRSTDEISQYTTGIHFRGFGQNKVSFLYNTIRKGVRSDIIILSHINLLPVGCVVKLLKPRVRLILFAHGIEVWIKFSPLRLWMLKYCDQLVAVSRYTRDEIVRIHGVKKDKITVLNNCIDPFLPLPEAKVKKDILLRRYGFAENDFILMTLSRFSTNELYKGYDQVLYAIAQLSKKYPNIKYLLVGKTDPLEEQRLKTLILNLDIEEKVVFTGYILDDELAAYFQLADLYIMPSKKEGFGIVFIEAMYYGLPVVAGNLDGSTDALSGGKNGLLVNPDNLNEIIEAVEKIIAEPERYVPDPVLLRDNFSYESYFRRFTQLLESPVI